MASPNGFPTAQEVSHYEGVLTKAIAALDSASTKPFDKQQYDNAIQDLKTFYDSFKNDNFWANSSGHSPLFDIPNAIKNVVDRGLIDGMLPTFQIEIEQAKANLKVLKNQINNTPSKIVLSYLLGKRD